MKMKPKMPLKTLGSEEHNRPEQWAVGFHEEFFAEFQGWSEQVQDALLTQASKLRLFGLRLDGPPWDTLKGSSFANMKELRFDAESGVWRVAFAFDPERKAILLCGGSKTGVSRDRFYEMLIRTADKRYTNHLARLEQKRGRK
jgi:hypothetical protein